MSDALNHRHITAATKLASPAGVLTVYAGVDHADPKRIEVELRTAFARMQPQNGTGAEDLARAIEQVNDQVEQLLVGPSATHRAIAGFIAIGTDDSVWCALPERVDTQVMVAERADVAPLLSLVEVYDNAGVIALSRGEIQAHDWSAGQLQLLETREVEVSTEDWDDSVGPNNAVAARGVSERGGRSSDPVFSGASRASTHDAHDAKLEQHTLAAVAEVGADVVNELARRHGWSRIVWFGEPSLVAATQAALTGNSLLHLDGGDQQVTKQTLSQLQARVHVACLEDWAARSDRLLHEVTEGPVTHRADDMQQILDAAREGRVGRLLVHSAAITDAPADTSSLNDAVTEVLRTGGDVNVLAGEPIKGAATKEPVLAALRW